ncbi:MAG: sigma-54-dependent transcriptional regulator [Desulfomonilia bacterium]|jgi:two-component system nitrogen regulation response regulator NtrX|uniref:Nitrogen assimilation regulatory protein NtrX n=1 Tax=anaerobic digester metagenome TaxID=1263854 RepID=A0A485LZY2_9ZZZZ|nr:sigma-54 dependent transcriptional regulator [Pseudomonadota bacterium]HPD21228.1 sigma-54 dependent transcriptional regulator [Deltaproteobacteria bacterium]HPX18261.1 sigma-54 dependent transcriptional regulator [Deltaproteobacteria bacterium]HRS55778.1 sigma-54 dependent transcriptional regulator [Desulfomonilia bacterium]HRV34458.1 sigma-54 dependent transcriptional regulator [Desulfomonilia bacterium]
MKRSILIVDDEESIRFSLKGGLEDEGYHTLLAANGEEAVQVIERNEIDLILLDIWMPGKDGLQILEELNKSGYRIPVIIMTGHGSIDTAVRATRLGALDFIEKPLDLNKIIITINNTLHLRALEEENALLRMKAQKDDEIVGNSPAIRKLKEQIDRAAPSDAWVLILGENGTGKELVARRLHKKSQRNKQPFVEVNCAAIPQELIESELFGHEKGAFTGATERRRGKFDLANNGTLFLDEIGDMSLPTQAKILRILQEQRFERVGGSQTIQVDVRVLTATNKDLEKEIEAGRFRQDLYYRLNVIPIYVPRLADRKDDIPELVEHFLKMYASLKGGKKKTMTEGAVKKLMQHDWPGNVRELKNIVERLVIMTPGDTITADDILPLSSRSSSETDKLIDIPLLKDARAQFEKMFIENKLKECGYNISKTADLIGVERSNLHRKIKGLGIDVG